MTHCVLIAVALVLAAPAGHALMPPRDKPASCDAQATSLHIEGENREAFMKGCLSTGSAEPARELTPQQVNMQACDRQADTRSMKGNDRRKFMWECMQRAAQSGR